VGKGPSSREKLPLVYDHLLLRGCFLKNTEWVIGLVLFTGKDTKIVLNTDKTPFKRTRIERAMNPQILVIFGIQLAFAAIFSICYRLVNAAEGTLFPSYDPLTFIPHTLRQVTATLDLYSFLTFW